MTRRYTSRDDIKSVAKPLFDLAQDILLYFEPPTDVWRGKLLAQIDETEIRHLRMHEMRNPPALTNHRHMAITGIFESGKTDVLTNLHSLLGHIPPLARTGKGLAFEIEGERDGHPPEFRLSWCSFDLWGGDEFGDLVRALYMLIRTHENMDMGETLTAWRLHSTHGTFLNNGHIVYADPAENALIRYAALDADVRAGLRKKAPMHAAPVSGDINGYALAAIKGRTRTAPAEPKSWVFA